MHPVHLERISYQPRRITHLGTALMALAFLTGCDGTGRIATPTDPSLPPPGAPTQPIVTGEITITSISPAPGATVPVRACGPETCADEPKLTLEMVIEQVRENIPNAVLSVDFDRCAYWNTPVGSITAGSRLSLTTSVLYLSDHGAPGTPAPFCEFPAVTTGIVVRLWRSGQPFAPPLLTRVFANSYTFARP